VTKIGSNSLDWGFVHDILHDPPTERSYNVKRVKRVSKEIRDFYIPWEKCLVCDRGHYGEKPDCLDICPCKTRTSDGSTLAVIDTRRRFAGIKRKPDPKKTLIIPRSMIEFNYVHKLPFVFRAGKGNGFEIHHRNGKPYDDRIENINIADFHVHRRIHGAHRTIASGIKRLDKFLVEGSISRRGVRNQIERDLLKLDDFVKEWPSSTRLWIYIKDMSEAVYAFEHWGEIPTSLVKRIESHSIV